MNSIEIIEGPTPIFESIEDDWPLTIVDSPERSDIRVTRLRSTNVPALVERCNKAWKNEKEILLLYKDYAGLEEKVPIVAVRCMERDGNNLLLLWVRFETGDTLAPYYGVDDAI